MGFRGRSGASQIALGAVRQFGLVDGLRGDIKISDRAMRILQPGSANEEEEARHEAAFSPEVYDKVVGHFDGELPRSDEPIKAFLIRSLSFSKSGAEECIATLRKTLSDLEVFRSALRQDEPSSVSSSTRSHELPPEERTDASRSAPVQAFPPITPEAYELIRIPLTRECTAELRLVGEVTSGAIDRLVQYIELMRGVWAED